ncbi:hypothetical protein ACFWVB_02500 [Streptomyces microflavus]|uniref:hypothetical protein n=1 Tax=Streptomyces microflavus TaxID=1919 RepID=UPI00365CCCCB
MTKTARLLTRARDGLHTGTARLHRGHHALMEAAAAYRPPNNPKTPQPEKPSGDDDSDGGEPDAQEEPKKKAPKKKAPAKGKKDAKDEGEKAEKEEDASPPLRPGPRRAARAATRWVSDGEGGWDFILRAGLLLAGLGTLAYFATPLLAELPLAVRCLVPVAVLLYDVTPRLSLLLGTGLVAFTADPFWATVGAVLLIGSAFAPLLAPLLALALTASALHPALMWPVALLWATAAWRAGALPEQVEEGTPEVLADEVEEPAEIHPLLLLCAALTGDANGVHLNSVVRALREAGSTAIEKPAHVRVLLLAQGVSVKASVRAPKWAIPGGPESTASGVYREDLERVIGPLSDLPPLKVTESVATGVASALTCDVANSATAVAVS